MQLRQINNSIRHVDGEITNKKKYSKLKNAGSSLVVQCQDQVFNCCGPDSIPGWGTKIAQPACCGQKKKKEKAQLY